MFHLILMSLATMNCESLHMSVSTKSSINLNLNKKLDEQLISFCMHPILSNQLIIAILTRSTKSKLSSSNPTVPHSTVFGKKLVQMSYNFKVYQYDVMNHRPIRLYLEDQIKQSEYQGEQLNHQYCDIKLNHKIIIINQQINAKTKQFLISFNDSKLIYSNMVSDSYIHIQTFQDTFIQIQQQPFMINQLNSDWQLQQSITRDSLVHVDDNLQPLILEHQQLGLVVNIVANKINSNNQIYYSFYRIQIYVFQQFHSQLFEQISYQTHVDGQILARDAITIQTSLYLVYILKIQSQSQLHYFYQLKLNVFKIQQQTIKPVYQKDQILYNGTSQPNSKLFLQLNNHLDKYVLISHSLNQTVFNISYIKHRSDLEHPFLKKVNNSGMVDGSGIVDNNNTINGSGMMDSIKLIKQDDGVYLWGWLDKQKQEIKYCLVSVDGQDGDEHSEHSYHQYWVGGLIILLFVVIGLVIRCIKSRIEHVNQSRVDSECSIDMILNHQKNKLIQ